jgi:hypothetical protein
MKKKIKHKEHKPIIETIINTAAISISGFGVFLIQQQKYFGFLCVLFAAGIEYFKYWGRNKNLW